MFIFHDYPADRFAFSCNATHLDENLQEIFEDAIKVGKKKKAGTTHNVSHHTHKTKRSSNEIHLKNGTFVH